MLEMDRQRACLEMDEQGTCWKWTDKGLVGKQTGESTCLKTANNAPSGRTEGGWSEEQKEREAPNGQIAANNAPNEFADMDNHRERLALWIKSIEIRNSCSRKEDEIRPFFKIWASIH